MILSDKAIEAIALLTDAGVGDIKNADADEDLTDLVVAALENFYDNYRGVALGQPQILGKIEPLEPLDHLCILENCLADTKMQFVKTTNADTKAMLYADMRDLRQKILILKGNNDE